MDFNFKYSLTTYLKLPAYNKQACSSTFSWKFFNLSGIGVLFTVDDDLFPAKLFMSCGIKTSSRCVVSYDNVHVH